MKVNNINHEYPSTLLSFVFRYKGLFLIIILFIVFYFYLDLYIAITFSYLNLRQTCIILKWLTCLGDGAIIIPFLLSGLFFRYLQKNIIWEKHAWFISQCIVFSGLICLFLKMIFGRARPTTWFNTHEYGFYWLKLKGSYWSFPSGHATTVYSIVFGLSVLFPRHRFLFIVVGTVIALTRVFLNYHYFSDVIVAGYLAGLEVSLLTYLRCKNYIKI